MSERQGLTPVEQAALLGHDCIDDPPSILTSAMRWTCTRCGRAVIQAAANVYGSAITKRCGE